MTVTRSKAWYSVIYAAVVSAILLSACVESRDTAAKPDLPRGDSSAAPPPDSRLAPPARRDTVLLYLAASLARPLAPLLDSFALRANVLIQRESGGSLEHARKITELHRVPDLLILADYDVFPRLLVPAHLTWYAELARNRMVVAYTDRSRHASEISPANWTTILTRSDVEVGRTDPDQAPAGYRTLIMFKLAERSYRDRGLAARLLANAPKRNMRPNAADLAALLQLHELDYVYDYESLAHTFGLRYVQLPKQIDLGDAALASTYAAESVRVLGGRAADSVTFVGGPILYALGIPTHAPHPDGAARLAAFLLSPAGRAALRTANVDALERPILVGSDVPASVRAAAER